MKPLLLDLFCGAGGAAMGYHRAGFEVIGYDIKPQPNYPFEFHQGDALGTLESLFWGRQRGLRGKWAAVHTSPPCQASCTLIKGNQRATAANHVDLIPRTRRLLEEIGLPSVIENVQGAKVRRDLTLCGEMFGLGVIRHRYFECSFPVTQPAHVPHRGRVRGWRHGQYFDGPYVAVYGDGGGKGSVQEWQQAMGIDWTDDRKEIAEANPPVFHGTCRPATHRVPGGVWCRFVSMCVWGWVWSPRMCFGCVSTGFWGCGEHEKRCSTG